MRNRIDAFRVRHKRVRKKITGSADRPRMAIRVTNRFMMVQFIDDAKGCTLASASTLKSDAANNIAAATLLGQTAAKCAAEAGIRSAVVDRGGHRYHGRVKAIVEAVAAVGLVAGVRPGAAEENEEAAK